MTKSSDGVFFLTGKDFTNAGSASSNLKGILDDMGIPADIVRRAAIAAFEAEMNAIIYAVAGMMRYSITPEAVTVTLQDMGPGIPDISRAMQDGYSTGKGLGVGLPGARRLMDEFLVISAIGKGTTVTMTKWVNWHDGRRPVDGP